MLLKLNSIILYALVAFVLTIALYPLMIRRLKSMKAGVRERSETATGDAATITKQFQDVKIGTPTMGGIVFFLVMSVMLVVSYFLHKLGIINNTLINRSETYILLVAFFGMGLLGLIDDYTKITTDKKIQGLGAKAKLVYMICFSLFIGYRFNVKLGIHHIDIRPLPYTMIFDLYTLHLWDWSVMISPGYIAFAFIFVMAITNAINISDGMDGLQGGMNLIVLSAMAIITFIFKRYLATTVVGIVVGTLLAYLRYNIYPAKIFMGDSGSLALGGLISTLIFLISIKIGFIGPFLIVYALFRVELWSSFLQITWKKIRKRKIFLVAPFHYYLQKVGISEPNIVMKFRLIQGVLASVMLIMIFYQISGVR